MEKKVFLSYLWNISLCKFHVPVSLFDMIHLKLFPYTLLKSKGH